MMKRIVCFGEVLMRFTPSMDGGWLKTNNIPVFTGGAEANVASALARWGIPVSYVTAVPENFLADQLLDFMHEQGIDTKSVHRSGNRIGTYYLPMGADLKNAKVIYDREHSAFWDLKPGMIDWEQVFDGAGWFHFSAICPALNNNVAEVCMEALKVARAKNMMISVDLNFREKLWKYGKEPAEVMPALVKYCDLVMGNVWAANKMLNVPLRYDLEKNERTIYLEQAKATAIAITKEYPHCKIVANTFRFSNENHISYYAELFSDEKTFSSSIYEAENIVDKVGSGDCFMAGLIYGYSKKLEPQAIIDFSTAAAFQKLFEQGDATSKSADEINAYIQAQ